MSASRVLAIRSKTSAFAILAIYVVALFGWLLAFDQAHAAALTYKVDTMSRLKDSSGGDVLSDHAIQFRTPTGVASGQTIVITMPSDFDGSNDPQGALDFSDVDLFEDTTPDGVCDGTAETLVASGATSSQWNAVFSGTENRILTITSGGASAIVAAASEICIMIGENATGGTANSQYANPTTAGTKTVTLSAGSGADTGELLVSIESDDQVVVTAVVDESLSFSIGANAVSFGTLDAANDRFATTGGGSDTEAEAHTLVAGTNAANGYAITVNGNTLTSGANTITAIGASNTASSTGTEQFGLRATASGGSGTVSVPYAASGFAFDSGAFPDEVAAATGSSSDTTYSVRYVGNITSATEAGTYTATLTYVATARY